MAKRFISVLFLLSLMLPIGISLIHSFHDHDTTICYAKTEHHVHKEKTDCDQLHYFNSTVSQDLRADESILKVYWRTFDHLIYASLITIDAEGNDHDRGPPIFNVL